MQQRKRIQRVILHNTLTGKRLNNPNSSKETPILIAAKRGVVEMVEKILDKFPVAVQDLDSNNKNAAALLAIENRQTHVYILLKEKHLSENVLRQVDNKGNNALHLAAAYQQRRPWLVSGAAFEMQWEIKWYETQQRRQNSARSLHRNTRRPCQRKGMDDQDHGVMLIGGSSYSHRSIRNFVNRASGMDENTGKPILENEPVFNLFAISSLVALSCSITALVFFLSIITSRFQAKDFATRLPRILLIGLTSMFISIVSILVSFCAGHSFVITDRMKSKALPIYAATYLPVTFFALAQLPLYYDLVLALFIEAPQRRHTRFPH
ncbi:Ankyrin repeat-containing protein [Melia azedarach]|uniref:Ankyrin repeat-containing protein n=1 Tax=Melia azedarach TaxID=155640 RepID=A0ACC1Y5A6_MELAZ|nr:Ankyrin repeat-containing protein [Melia azedarach]